MPIDYRQNHPLEPVDIARVFESSGIRRPTNDLPRIARMFASSSLVLSAWDGERLVGVCRSLTDFAYCCYLSDLAVDKAYQMHGIGREMVRRTQATIGDQVTLVLLAAPEAIGYYPKIGFEMVANAYIVRRRR